MLNETKPEKILKLIYIFNDFEKVCSEAPDFLEVSGFPSDKSLFWIPKAIACNYVYDALKARDEAEGRTPNNENPSGYETMGIPFALVGESLRRCASTIFVFLFYDYIILLASTSDLIQLVFPRFS